MASLDDKKRGKTRKDREKERVRDFERQNLVSGAGYEIPRFPDEPKTLGQNMCRRGYEAYRVSPQVRVKHGKEYRNVYGAVVEPDYNRPVRGSENKAGRPTKFGARVRWHLQGVVKNRGQKGGTHTCQDLKDYPIDQKEAKDKLMIREKKKKKKKKKAKKKEACPAGKVRDKKTNRCRAPKKKGQKK